MICRYERTIFKSSDGFCIFLYVTEDQTVPMEARRNSYQSSKKIHFSAIGHHLPETDTVEVDLDGKWQQSSYGVQLSVEKCEQKLPTDNKGIVAYLSSGFIKGIGPETAKAIVARFGNRTLEVMENDPQQLLTIKGIKQGKLQKIIDSYEKTRKLGALTAFLAPYDVSEKKIMKIQEKFGDNSLNIVKTDPFQLCRIKGFGFLTVNAIAKKTKVSPKNPLRYDGAIEYTLEEARNSGHLFLPRDELIDRSHTLLNDGYGREVVSKAEILTAIQGEHQNGSIYVEHERVYLTFERTCEVKAAKRLVSLLLSEPIPKIRNLDDEIKRTEAKIGQTLAPSQRNAVKLCLENRCAIMTGGPGVGKTTTLRAILDIYHRLNPDNELLLAAPTGKASRRMTEQTGFPAFTLHSAMGIISEEDLEEEKPDFLSADFIVIDEYSMVDMKVTYALFQRLKPGVQILFVGDPDQLPSVGAGNVLRELLRCGVIPTAVLDTVFRQASNSRIFLNAYAVNNNDTNLQFGDDFALYEAKDSEAAAALVIRAYLSEVKKKGIEGVQILSPFRKRGAVGADQLNKEIRDLINPQRAGVNELKHGSKVFREGDRIIQTKNNEAVSNGDVGVIERIYKDDDGEVQIDIKLFDGRAITYSEDLMDDVDWSYCITIHKSQGTEVPTAIIPLMKEHYIMLRRNLLYTAISRAKEKVILIGQRQAVYMAIHRSDVDKRNTVFADRIVAYLNREVQKRAC